MIRLGWRVVVNPVTIEAAGRLDSGEVRIRFRGSAEALVVDDVTEEVWGDFVGELEAWSRHMAARGLVPA